MCMLRPVTGGRAVSQIIRGKKICLGGIIQQIIARIDSRVEMSVDEPGRDKTTASVDGLIHRLAVLFADKRDAIAVENHSAVADDLVLLAVEANDVSALNE